MDIEKRVNSVTITPEELLKVSEEVHKLPERERDFEGRSILMIKMFSGEPDKVTSIDLRLTAMSEMIDTGNLPGWATPKQPDGSVLIAEPVWVAAVEEPLLFKGNDAYFDKEKFLEKVLSSAIPEGRA